MVRWRGGGKVVRRWGSSPLKLRLRGSSPPEFRPQVLLAVVRPLWLDHPLLDVGGICLLLAARLLLLSLAGRRGERALPNQGGVKSGNETQILKI